LGARQGENQVPKKKKSKEKKLGKGHRKSKVVKKTEIKVN